MDISLITLKLVRKQASASTLDAYEYLASGVTDLGSGHNYATVTAQFAAEAGSPFPNNLAKLNIGDRFIKGKWYDDIDPDTGLNVGHFDYHINIAQPVNAEVTVENAYEKYLQYRAEYAAAHGLTELNNWYIDYVNANYVITHSAAIDTSEVSAQWWLDHELNYK